jgi:hypothetical protein
VYTAAEIVWHVNGGVPVKCVGVAVIRREAGSGYISRTVSNGRKQKKE